MTASAIQIAKSGRVADVSAWATKETSEDLAARYVSAMRDARPSGVYLLFVLLTGAQLGLFELAGVLSHVSTRGSEFMLVVIVALAFRSRIAWSLLVLLNGIPLLAILMTPLSSSSGSAHVLWGHLALMLITGIALEATLLSPAMRRFVGRRAARHRSGRRPAFQ